MGTLFKGNEMLSEALDFSVSARGKAATNSIAAFLEIFFEDIPVKSVFAFREYTPLYGGRIYHGPELSDTDIHWMYDHGIGYRIPLQNIVTSREEYLSSKPFLEKYHRKGNSVITARGELAKWIREDFPLFELEASVINQVRTLEKLSSFLETYDVVVLHPIMNDDLEALATITDKARVRLFVNAGCMYQCPTMECYGSISRMNKLVPNTEFKCAQDHVPDYAEARLTAEGMTEFDTNTLVNFGFTRFKRMRNKSNTAY
jgi:hypothetical protein